MKGIKMYSIALLHDIYDVYYVKHEIVARNIFHIFSNKRIHICSSF